MHGDRVHGDRVHGDRAATSPGEGRCRLRAALLTCALSFLLCLFALCERRPTTSRAAEVQRTRACAGVAHGRGV